MTASLMRWQDSRISLLIREIMMCHEMSFLFLALMT